MNKVIIQFVKTESHPRRPQTGSVFYIIVFVGLLLAESYVL